MKEDGAFILHPGEFVLGSTLERVALPDDLVARLEGKSSLGRLGLLIHSSLPASETVMVLDRRTLATRGRSLRSSRSSCGVRRRVRSRHLRGRLSRDHRLVRGSARSDLRGGPRFGPAGARHCRAQPLHARSRRAGSRSCGPAELRAGVRIAVPRRIPDPSPTVHEIDLVDLVPESEYSKLVCEGPTITARSRIAATR